MTNPVTLRLVFIAAFNQSAALFDADLTEFVGLNSEDPSVRAAHEFVAAVNRGDV